MNKTIIIIGLVILLWLAWVICNVQFAFGFVGTALCGGFLIISLLLTVGLALLTLIKKNIKFAVAACILFLFILSGMFVSMGINRRKRRQSISSGEHIVQALETYKSKKGQYPTELSQLVPEFTKSIPATKMKLFGHPKFKYDYRDDSKIYHISFDLESWYICSYDSERKEWWTHD